MVSLMLYRGLSFIFIMGEIGFVFPFCLLEDLHPELSVESNFSL
jgi:hypothetical protein